MADLSFWLSAVIVGIILLKLVPSSSLSGLNRKMHEKIPGVTLTVLYILIFVMLFIAIGALCFTFNVNQYIRNVLCGAVLGAFIGLIPLVDKRNMGK